MLDTLGEIYTPLDIGVYIRFCEIYTPSKKETIKKVIKNADSGKIKEW